IAADKFDAARSVFLAARDASIAAFGADDGGTLWINTELARVADLQGDYATARKLGEANLANMIRVLGAEHPSVGSTLNRRGWAVMNAGDYDAAAAYLTRALAIKEKVGGDAAWTATTLNNLGFVERMRGKLDRAEQLNDRALAIRRRILPPGHPEIATS